MLQIVTDRTDKGIFCFGGVKILVKQVYIPEYIEPQFTIEISSILFSYDPFDLPTSMTKIDYIKSNYRFERSMLDTFDWFVSDPYENEDTWMINIKNGCYYGKNTINHIAHCVREAVKFREKD